MDKEEKQKINKCINCNNLVNGFCKVNRYHIPYREALDGVCSQISNKILDEKVKKFHTSSASNKIYFIKEYLERIEKTNERYLSGEINESEFEIETQSLFDKIKRVCEEYEFIFSVYLINDHLNKL